LTSASNTWTSVAAGGGYFVAIANNASANSTSGSSWTISSNLNPTFAQSVIPTWTSVAYGNTTAANAFIAVANSSNLVSVSTSNGAAWTTYSGLPGALNWVGVSSSSYSGTIGNTWVAIANNTATQNLANVIISSASGTFSCNNANTLTIGQQVYVTGTQTATSFTLSSVTITGTAGQFSFTSTATPLFVGQSIIISGTYGGAGSITGYSSPGPQTYYIIATDGRTTATLSSTFGGSAITTTAGTPTGLTYTVPAPVLSGYSGTANTYYITATNGNNAFTLANTVGGPAVTTVAGVQTGLSFTTYPAVVAFTSNVASNSTWTSATLPVAANWTSIAYGNGRWVAISSSGQVVWSTNGSVWNWSTSQPVLLQTAATGAIWQNISFGNGYFLATSGGPALWGAISIDGVQWSLVTLPSSQNWVGSSFGTSSWVVMAGASAANTTANTSVMSTFNTNPFNPVNGVWTVTSASNNSVQFNSGISYNTQTIPANTTISGLNSGTNIGALDFTKTYLPYGFDYGGNYFWNEQINCFLVGSHGRIYTMDPTGVILDEIDLNTLGRTQGFTSFDYSQGIKHLVVTASGKIVFVTDTLGYNQAYTPSTAWSSLTSSTYGAAISPILNSVAISRSNLLNNPTNLNAIMGCSLTLQQDGSDLVTLLSVNTPATPIVSYALFTGTSWTQSTGTAVTSTTAGSWNVGWRPNFKLIQDNITGGYRILGALGTDTSANYSYMGISSNAYTSTQFGLLSTTAFNTGSTASPNGYGISFRQSTNYQTAAVYDPATTGVRVYTSTGGRLSQNYLTGYQAPINANAQYSSVTTSKYGTTVALQNTGPSQNNAIAYVFDTINMSVPKLTLTTGLGSGQITTYPTGKLSWQHYGANTDTIYTVSGQNDIARFVVTLNSGNADYYLTPTFPQGQQISTSQATNFRTTDTYLVPPGYSIKMGTDSANSISALITVVEEI
jgi:hypothetical protein